MKDWNDMRKEEFEKYLIKVYGDTSWKAYLFKTRPPQIITVVCGVLSIIIAAVVILSSTYCPVEQTHGQADFGE